MSTTICAGYQVRLFMYPAFYSHPINKDYHLHFANGLTEAQTVKGPITVGHAEIHSLSENKADFLLAVPCCLRCSVSKTRKRQRIK